MQEIASAEISKQAGVTRKLNLMDTNLILPALPEEIERQYWEIFEAVSDGLIIHDLETQRIVEANPAAAAMHGYSRRGIHRSAPDGIYPS